MPTDRKNLAWRSFYGFWSLVGMARTSARIALAARTNDGSIAMTVAGTSSVAAPIVGLGLAAVESILVAASFVAALWEQRQTGRALKEAERKQRDVVGALTRHVRGRQEEAIRQRRTARVRLDGASILEDVVPDEAGARAPGAAEGPAARDAKTGELERAAHDAILDRTLTAVRARDSHAALIEASLAMSRDTVVQGALAGSAIAQTLKELAFNVCVVLKQAAQASQILAMAMGAAHVVTGVVALWRAVRQLCRHNRTVAAFSAAKRRLQTAAYEDLSPRECNHRDRIASGVGQAVLGTYERIRREHRGNAIRSAIWAGLRIAYGASSTAVTIVSLLALLAGATGGAAVPIVMAALGTGWLIFAVYRLLVGKRAKVREQGEAAAFAAAMKEMTGHPDLACALKDCGLHDLESLPSFHRQLRLDNNKYYRAALLARYLHIEDEAGKDLDIDLKEARVRASAALQLMGVPRELTQILKRSSLQTSYSWILGYLGGDDNRALLDTDPAVLATVATLRTGGDDAGRTDPALSAETVA